MNLGYACINTELNKNKITTNRTLRRKTFYDKGIRYVSKLALQNAKDLYSILEWNEKNNIKFFRVSSGILPWFSLYKFEDLPDADEIKSNLKNIGVFAKNNNHRLTTHPDHFVKLASKNPEVVQNSIDDLEMHGFIFDMMDLSLTPYNKINIHIGQGVGELVDTAKRFIQNSKYLSKSVLNRLTIENDDKDGLYDIMDLIDIFDSNGAYNFPIVMDMHHHNLNNKNNLSTEYVLSQVISIWKTLYPEITPVIHYSSSKKLNEDINVKTQAHADYIYEKINTYGHDVDVMLECKAKELALIKYRNQFSN